MSKQRDVHTRTASIACRVAAVSASDFQRGDMVGLSGHLVGNQIFDNAGTGMVKQVDDKANRVMVDVHQDERSPHHPTQFRPEELFIMWRTDEPVDLPFFAVPEMEQLKHRLQGGEEARAASIRKGRKKMASLKELKAFESRLRKADRIETVGDGDTEDLVDAMEEELSKYIGGASEVNDNEILFHEEETKKGSPVNIRVTVDPTNQPKKKGERGFCLFIEGNDALYEDEDDLPEGIGELVGTLNDSCWTTENDQPIKEEAKLIGQTVKKILRKW